MVSEVRRPKASSDSQKWGNTLAKEQTINSTVNVATGFGAVAAGTLSYHMWGSFWLALGHTILGWWYVAYHVVNYGLPVIHRY